jgi:hypothetical protein
MDSHVGVVGEVKKQIRKIEVDFKGKLTTISFCYLPIFSSLSKDTKEFLINRFSLYDTRIEKLKNVINLRHIINQDIAHHQQSQVFMSQSATNSLFHFSIVLCYLLVALQLFFFSVNRTGTVLDKLESRIIHGLTLLQFFSSFLYFVLWGWGVSPLTREKIKQKYQLGGEKEKVRMTS